MWYSCIYGKMDQFKQIWSYYTLTELLNVNWEEYDDCHLDGFLQSLERMKEIDEDTDNIRMCFFLVNISI